MIGNKKHKKQEQKINNAELLYKKTNNNKLKKYIELYIYEIRLKMFFMSNNKNTKVNSINTLVREIPSFAKDRGNLLIKFNNTIGIFCFCVYCVVCEKFKQYA